MKLFQRIKFLFIICTIAFVYTVSESNISEKPIVIVIPSYNNKDWYKRNLDSVLQQDYSNFTVIYTDDCSPDNTGALVDAYLTECDHNNRVQLIKNNTRLGALHNLYMMIHSCDDNVIIATLDGDDWLPDNNTLKRLNEAYSSKDIWLTYGQFQLYPSEIIGWASAMPDYIVQTNSFRDFQHLPTHLRTFYAWLFKEIKLEDLLYLGNFYTMTWDMAMMFPMIEMAGERHAFISDIMYIYNDANSISDHRVSRQLQAHLAQIIKKKNRYSRLKQKPEMDKKSKQCADIIIFFNQNEQQLKLLLESLEEFVCGIGNQYVLCQSLNTQQKSEFEALQIQYPHITFYYIDEHNANFRDVLMSVYKQIEHSFILFTKGDTIFTEKINLTECVEALRRTQAYAFYFNLSGHNAHYANTPLVTITNDIAVWNFSLMRDKWSCANSFDTVLHRKSQLLFTMIQEYPGLTPEILEIIWANEGKLDRIGLCYKNNHVKIMIE